LWDDLAEADEAAQPEQKHEGKLWTGQRAP
jgi:hypothetical protein